MTPRPDAPAPLEPLRVEEYRIDAFRRVRGLNWLAAAALAVLLSLMFRRFVLFIVVVPFVTNSLVAAFGRRGRLRVAPDGILVETFMRRRFAPMYTVRRVDAEPGALVIQTSDGRRTRLSTEYVNSDTGDYPALLAARIRDMLELARQLSADVRPELITARGTGPFRSAPRSELLRVVEAPLLDDNVRLAALDALGPLSDAERARLAELSRHTLSPKIAEALATIVP